MKAHFHLYQKPVM